jgi:hypothetical protein
VSEQISPEQQFLAAFTLAIQQQRLLKLVLSKYQGQEQALQRITIKQIILRDEPHLSWVYSYQTNDVTKNFTLSAGIALVSQLLGTDFKNANLFTTRTRVTTQL